jgi:hypothetical protein
MKKFVLMFIPALICGVVFTSFVSNKTIPKEKGAIGEKSEWWQPILQKFNLKLGAYNNFDNVFVMGMEGNSINNGICTLKAATVLIRGRGHPTPKLEGGYLLLEADSVHYNIKERTFEFMPDAKKAYGLDADLNEISAFHGSITRIELMEGGGVRIISRSNR